MSPVQNRATAFTHKLTATGAACSVRARTVVVVSMRLSCGITTVSSNHSYIVYHSLPYHHEAVMWHHHCQLKPDGRRTSAAAQCVVL